MRSLIPSASFVLAAPLCGQIGSVPGTDIQVYDVLAPTVAGRQGPAYPNGEADPAGAASVGLAIPSGLMPLDIHCKGFELVPGGPLLGFLAASNGLRIRAGGTGCA